MADHGRIIVVAGLPGAGKTTTSALLAARLPRAAHVEADRLQELIVSGKVWPEARDMSDAAFAQLRLRLHNSCLLARSFADAGFDAVIDDIIIGTRVEDLLDDLDGTSFHFVMLLPDFSHLRRRWEAIDSPFVEEWGWMDDEQREHTRRFGLWLDTTRMGPDEVVGSILDRLDDALVAL